MAVLLWLYSDRESNPDEVSQRKRGVERQRKEERREEKTADKYLQMPHSLLFCIRVQRRE